MASVVLAGWGGRGLRLRGASSLKTAKSSVAVPSARIVSRVERQAEGPEHRLNRRNTVLEMVL